MSVWSSRHIATWRCKNKVNDCLVEMVNFLINFLFSTQVIPRVLRKKLEGTSVRKWVTIYTICLRWRRVSKSGWCGRGPSWWLTSRCRTRELSTSSAWSRRVSRSPRTSKWICSLMRWKGLALTCDSVLNHEHIRRIYIGEFLTLMACFTVVSVLVQYTW